jgi:hypothetical protein
VQARAAWNPAKQPSWLTEKVFSEKIQPALEQASATASAKRIGVSRWYAGRIREGYTCLFGFGAGGDASAWERWDRACAHASK